MAHDRALPTGGEREERAALRDRILTCGRRLGWPAHTAVVFTEQRAGRPWKRCTCTDLAAVLDELQVVLAAGDSPHESQRTAARERSLPRVRGERHAPLVEE